MKRRSLLLSGGAALAAVGGYSAWTRMTGGGADPGSSLILPNAAMAETATPPADAPVDTSRVQEMEMGDPNAPVTVIEFASFTCPHCAHFHDTVWKELKSQYIDTGKVRFIYREVYFDAYGLWAGLVARCGGPMRYFGIVDMLYDQQQQWAHGADANEVANNLRRIGRAAGLTDEELNTCLTDRDKALAMMEVYRQGAEQYNIQGTPSFVINGTTYSNMPFAEFQSIIDPLLNQG